MKDGGSNGSWRACPRHCPSPRVGRAVGLLLLTLAIVSTASARRGAPPTSTVALLTPTRSVPVLSLPRPDVEALRKEDERAVGPGPLRFAARVETCASPRERGVWEAAPGGARIWRLRVSSPGATDLNFGFSRFRLPPGATLHVIPDADPARHEGPYTAADNEEHGELWTPVVPGDAATIELFVPSRPSFEPELELSVVGHGYLDLFRRAARGEKSGACNIDVACPQGDPWRDEIRSVAHYALGGDRLCTGTLIMDVPRTLRSWFLTATHCQVTAALAPSMVVYWNFEASTCGGPRDGSLDQSQTGAVLRSANEITDHTLVELDDVPPAAYDVYHAGWDRSDVPPLGSVTIHHPSRDEKAISVNDDPVTHRDGCLPSAGVDTHWHVDDWEDGTTEGGSSGAGLWDADTHLLVGVLSGGAASCLEPTQWDCYGRFAVAWDLGATAAERLSDWLDPGGTGVLVVPGEGRSPTMHVAGRTFADSCVLGAGDGNSIVEPGEDAVLEVVLRATADLTSVRGTLVSRTPGVTVVDGDASWPDLMAGVPAASDAPHFLLRVDAGVVGCFGPMELELEVTADGAGPFTFTITEPIGRGAGVPEVPVPIVDRVNVGSDLEIEQSLVLEDLDVRVVLEHDWIGDLILGLRAPSGDQVILLRAPLCGDDDLDIVFDDDSVIDLSSHCDGTTPWYAGPARPEEPLSTFAGQDVRGTWTLLVADRGDGDTGRVTWWELRTTPPLDTACDACAEPCEGQVVSASAVRVRKLAGGDLSLAVGAAVSPCASGIQVRMARTARPAAGGMGEFPTDPEFVDVTDQDADPGADYRHRPPTGDAYYLVVEGLPGRLPGPSGHYGR